MPAVLAQAIHRDIAVRNYLVDEDGRIVLGDFGLAEFLPQGEDSIGAWERSVLSCLKKMGSLISAWRTARKNVARPYALWRLSYVSYEGA